MVYDPIVNDIREVEVEVEPVNCFENKPPTLDIIKYLQNRKYRSNDQTVASVLSDKENQ